MPLASTGLGKGLMLGLPRDQWRRLYERARDSGSQTQERRLASYVERDWSFDLEENEIGIRCVGAPVRDVRNPVVAAISVSSAVPYMPDDRMTKLGPVVSAAANAISKELRWKPE